MPTPRTVTGSAAELRADLLIDLFQQLQPDDTVVLRDGCAYAWRDGDWKICVSIDPGNSCYKNGRGVYNYEERKLIYKVRENITLPHEDT